MIGRTYDFEYITAQVMLHAAGRAGGKGLSMASRPNDLS
jgi:hypothetical protein